MRFFRYASCMALMAVVACGDPLNVPNEDDPDRGRVLRSPADVETLIGSSYAVMHDGIMDNIGLSAQMISMGMENHSTLANFEMGPRGAVARGQISNQRGNAGQGEHVNDWNALHRSARLAALGLAAFVTPGFSLGNAASDARARAFAKFTQGVSLGNLALIYDSAAVVTEFDDLSQLVPFASYDSVMRAALAALDSAIAISAGMGTLRLPANWLNGNELTRADFVRLIRSHKARFRAGVARNRADRAGADWNAILADATNGITANFMITMDPSGPWDIQWVVQHYLFANWHQMWQFMVGFGDVSGAFDAWLSDPYTEREPFVVVTPDRRFPQGATRDEQITNSPALPTGNQYFRNRPPGEDAPGIPLGESFYDHYRFRAFFNAGRRAPFPVMTKAEIDLLAAEAHLRLNNVPAAAALIDLTRVGRGSLPGVTGMTDTVSAVPGAASCVPRVPVGPSFTSTACGNIWEALKWEYRLETAYTGYGQWYIAGRGWGDLPEGTAIHWAVPYQEMDARRQAFYDMGGVNQVGGVVCPCGYGLVSGGVYP